MLPFSYHRISQDFIRELAEKISDGEGVVVLGPRYGGKRYMLSCLYNLILESNLGPCVKLWPLGDFRLSTTERVMEVVRKAVLKVHEGADAPPEASPSDDLLWPLESLFAAHPHKPVFLFASNVDGMSHHLARRFLQEVSVLYESKRVVPVMSGEGDFSELVYGPNSEFTSANQYVLQGYVEEEFRTFLDHHLEYLRLKFESPDAACRRMWELTGGNLYILRLILWVITHDRAQRRVPPSTPVTVEEIPSEVRLSGIPGVYGEHIFRHSAQLISRDPECWVELAKLIDGEPLETYPNMAPGRLELSGIAVREESGDRARLRFSSPVMEVFIRRHYDARRFGDLYAAVGLWDKAFDYYSRIGPEERIRPSGTDDRADIEATVAALCSSFYSGVARLEEDNVSEAAIMLVKERFARGCHYILGFSEITFWQHDVWQSPGRWRPQSPNTFSPGGAELDQITRILQAVEYPRPHVITPEEPLRRLAAGALLPAHLNRQEAVVVSDFRNGNSLSRGREELLNRVLREFIRAYRHAVDTDNFRLRRRVRDRHVNFMTEIFQELGASGLSVHDILRKAAAELRRSEFRRRVMFCLVDEGRGRITYAADDSDEPTPDVLREIDWPLEGPAADVQPSVVRDRKFVIVKDARDPRYLVNQAVARAARLKTFAVVPMLSPSGKVIGTIHVEHEDGRTPTTEEVSDLMSLGRQLAVAVEQCRRVSILEQEREQEKSMIRKSVADQMMATMAHTLHTRLASLPVILSRYRHMEKTYPELAPLNGDLGEIYDEIRVTVKRAKELLSLAPPRLKTVDIGELIVTTLRRHLNDGEWEMSCEECPLEVRLDPNQFATALLELIQNSRDAVTPPQALLVSVKAETARGATGGEGALITFRDNGPGVPAEVGEEIFEDFYSHRRNGEAAGTGLGLGFVRRVVEAHGGHVFYNESPEDGHRGAEFRIRIPRFAEGSAGEEKTGGQSSNS